MGHWKQVASDLEATRKPAFIGYEFVTMNRKSRYKDIQGFIPKSLFWHISFPYMVLSKVPASGNILDKNTKSLGTNWLRISQTNINIWN